MESVVTALEIYREKKVFITGHTGFKGSWLVAMLQYLQADITGYALTPDTIPDHFSLLEKKCTSHIADIRDAAALSEAVNEARPDIIFHLAAQPLVRRSYIEPLNTYQTNVIGTLNVLEAARKCSSVKAIVCITTDKVYENIEQQYAYKETDRLGGYDMYSSSKACCELLIDSYRNSFLNLAEFERTHHMLIGVARAGNVIGGGDWSENRLIPDIVKATAEHKAVDIRNPQSVRPWQHVLDCLYGYLLLGQRLLNKDITAAGAWNFSPPLNDNKTVADVIAIAKEYWNNIDITHVADTAFHEANLLQLDNSKAVTMLNWHPLWNTEASIERTITWYKEFYENKRVITTEQIAEYFNAQNLKN